jgi:predicted dehydrogenase
VAKDVVGHGKHLIMEKPVAATVSQAKDIIKLSKKVKLMVAENFRYEEENNIIKNLIDDKAIGNVVYFIDNNIIEFQADMAKDKFAATEWRQHPDFRGGIFLDSGVHHIARQRFLFANVKSVYAQGRSAKTDWCPYSSVNAMLRFGGEITGVYNFFCIGRETQAPPVGLRIFGTSGEIYLESKECGFVNFTTKDGEHQAIPYTPNSGYTNELINFHEAVANGMSIISTPEKGVGDMAVIFDILNSIESGEVVEAASQLKKKAVRK